MQVLILLVIECWCVHCLSCVPCTAAMFSLLYLDAALSAPICWISPTCLTLPSLTNLTSDLFLLLLFELLPQLLTLWLHSSQSMLNSTVCGHCQSLMYPLYWWHYECCAYCQHLGCFVKISPLFSTLYYDVAKYFLLLGSILFLVFVCSVL